MLTNAKVRSRVRELQETLSAGTIALEISSRNARVQALQNRWERMRRVSALARLPARRLGNRTRRQREPRRDDCAGHGDQRPRASGGVLAPRGLNVATDICR